MKYQKDVNVVKHMILQLQIFNKNVKNQKMYYNNKNKKML